MARIKLIQPDEATGILSEVFANLIEKRGKVSEVLAVQSLHPASIQSHLNLYMDIMFAKTSLSRPEKEMIAVVVSVTNGCVYCKTHHAVALNNYWKDEARVTKLIADYKIAGLSFREAAMCTFAIHLTKYPAQHENNDHTNTLKIAGLTDEGILDTVLVTAYFNFVNRIVLSLGVELEKEGGTGYKY